ncbi:MAG TPA: GTPase ObgE [Patescibacteria group bacterium]|nr:GTPase ObgE [Patescibacteria group bacterium]
MLVDNVNLLVKAGNGGNGAATFLSNARNFKGGPDGGNGGNGGSIYIQGSNNIADLSQFRYQKKITAEDGVSGRRKNLYGKNAPDETIFVPLGTRITDLESHTSYEIVNITDSLLIAKGGKGGRGNMEFKSATNQSPRVAEKGTVGERKELFLELRLIAQVGLIGLPNSGKSSLLAVLTNATPKIGNYPFTTLEPNIGMLEDYAIADIPGLIEGASIGKGLGIGFLRHIEKTEMLIHTIDATVENPKKTYTIVKNEFKKFNPKLLEKPEVILITKIDLIDEKKLKEIIAVFKKMKKEVLTYSLYNPESIDALKKRVKNSLKTSAI